MFSRYLKKSDDVLIRPLTKDDAPELDAMIQRDPVAFLYAAEQLQRMGLPNTSTLNGYRSPYGFIGIFEPVPALALPSTATGTEPQEIDRNHNKPWNLAYRSARTSIQRIRRNLPQAMPGTPEEPPYQQKAEPAPSYKLVGAFWLGSNCVPLIVRPEHMRAMATVVSRAAKHISSIFGTQEEVLALWDIMQSRMSLPLSVRSNQPLMLLEPQTNLGKLLRTPLTVPGLRAPALAENVRWARTSDRASLLKASIAMFTEEIGYDPMTRDPLGYPQRIDEYIRTGRSLVAVNTEGIVVFKVDIGLAHADICQLQGVWLHPAYRGHGLSEPLLAQACELIRPRFPQISLYVNDYNERALALYRRVGFSEKGAFASILF